MAPKVTIGIPAYCNEATIARAIDSIIAQNYKNWRLVISDDASPDRTAELCLGYSRLHKNIEFVSQPKNLYYMNFRYLLDKAETPYFVWLAGDDYWSPNFLDQCIDFLDTHPDYACCASRAVFTGADGSTHESAGTRALSLDETTNIVSYLSHPMDNSRIYGVFRTNKLIDCFPDTIVHAWDWAFCAATLRLGKHHELNGIHLFREKTEGIDYSRAVYKDEKNTVYRLFPILHMSVNLILNRKIPIKVRPILSLFSLNIQKHHEQMRAMYPSYYKRLRYFYQWILVPTQEAARKLATKAR